MRPKLLQSAPLDISLRISCLLMDEHLPQSHRFAAVAAAFEGGLVAVALAAGWLVGQPPLASFSWSLADLGWGVLATLGPLAVLWFCLRSRLRPLVELTRVVDDLLVPLFRRCGLGELAAISLLAGIGEEMLFRGVIQRTIADWIDAPGGLWIGLTAAAVLFGLAHCVTVTYALLAGLIGFYLGGIWLIHENLLVPITTHALYDFLVLVYLVKLRKHAPTETCD